MTITNSTPLSEVLYALALAMPLPDARTLEEYVRRYPQHADELTEFAVELALEPDADDVDETDHPAMDAAISPAVSRALSHFQNVAFELEKGSGAGAAYAATNPFAALDRTEFRGFSSKLGVNNTFAMKLRDRLIQPETIVSRTGFCQTVAEGLGEPMDVMVAHFQAAPSMPTGAHYKADGKPAVMKRETFEEAVRNSGLTVEQQQLLLGL